MYFNFILTRIFEGDANTSICGLGKLECYQNAEDKLREKTFVEGLKNEHSIATSCNCLPSCSSITYDAEITQSKFNMEGVFNAFLNPLDEFPG